MSNVNALLSERLKKKEKSSKMAAMAKESAAGNLTTFSGIFCITELNNNEKDYIEAILHEYTTGDQDINHDLTSLISITAEVKAINNQAVILHGERVKKAHNILTRYQDGAFTAWMVAAYGNRQTPYNFMQYFEFYQAMPRVLRPLIEAMPRQAVYSLASREGSIDKKQQIVENYDGETKAEILSKIREIFPLSNEDKRRQDIGENTIKTLHRIDSTLRKPKARLTKKQKRTINNLLDQIKELVC